MAAPETLDPETGEVIVVEDAAMIWTAKQDAAMLDVQVATAKQYPRSIQHFQSDLESWCTLDRDTAMECFFDIPRGGKRVIGPSVRFAELVCAAWTNIIVDTSIVAEERDHVIVSATCRDLQRNIAQRAQVRRSIVDSKGRRYKADMIQQAVQAASAIARRNAIFQVVPRALWAPKWEKARALALAGEKGESFQQKRQRILNGLKESGCVTAHIKHAMGGKDPKDLSADDVLVLELAMRRITANESTPESEFPRPVNDGEDSGESAAKASEALKNGAKSEAAANDDLGDPTKLTEEERAELGIE